MKTARLFDSTSGEFKPFDPKRRLTVTEQLMLASAIKALDADRIKELWTKYKLLPPGDMSALAFWGTVHYLRIGLINTTEHEKAQSEHWLRQNGFDLPEHLKRTASVEKIA